jgi:hypothetical protein
MSIFDIFSGKVSYLNDNFYSNFNTLFETVNHLDTPLKPFFLDSCVSSHIIIESILNVKSDNKFSEFVTIKDYKLISKTDFSNAFVILLTDMAYQFVKVNPFLNDEIYSTLFKISSNAELSKSLLEELNSIKELDLLKIDRVVWKLLVNTLKIVESPGPASLVFFSAFKNTAFNGVLKKFKETVELAGNS